jgi:hypothetical protein
MSRFVYVVCFGERYEGLNPVSAHASLEGALGEAEQMYGARPRHHGGVYWEAAVNSTDVIAVQRFIIRGFGPGAEERDRAARHADADLRGGR